MGVIILLLVCSVLIAAGFLAAFMVVSQQGHYNDLQTPPITMLFNDQSQREQHGDDHE